MLSRYYANCQSYNPGVVKHTNKKPALQPVQDYAEMRERGSDADWFRVEFLAYYAFADKTASTYQTVNMRCGRAKMNVGAGGRSGMASGR